MVSLISSFQVHIFKYLVSRVRKRLASLSHVNYTFFGLRYLYQNLLLFLYFLIPMWYKVITQIPFWHRKWSGFFRDSFQPSRLKDNQDKVLLNICKAGIKNIRISIDLLCRRPEVHTWQVLYKKRLVSSSGIHFTHEHSTYL